MRLSRNVTTALIIAAVVIVWLATGKQELGYKASAADAAAQKSAQERASQNKKSDSDAKSDEPFRVVARKMSAEPHAAEIVVHGRTQAARAVSVKSETSGTIAKVDVEKGASVKAGDVICELQPDARQAQVDEAMAALKQAQLEYQASSKLAAKGYRSPTDVAAAKAKLDSATAGVRAAQIELERTKLRAPFDGVVDDRPVEVGDFVQPGGTCARVVDLDPVLVVGQVSEQDVDQLNVGEPGHAKLMDGTDHQGKVRFVGKSADLATRTFRIELELPNPDGAIRDGETADIKVPVKAVMAQHVSSAILTLDDKGVLGVRTVDAKNMVQFFPVTVIADASDGGVWVSGLPNDATVITVGQEYVAPGQKVLVSYQGDGVKS